MQISISEIAAGNEAPSALAAWVKARAATEGFDAAGVTSPDSVRSAAPDLHTFLEAGFHGEMSWLAANADRRGDPRVLWREVRSIVMLGLSYAPESNPLAALESPGRGAISVYAQGEDYHDIIKRKLKNMARDLASRSGSNVKVFVDTAPVMEKPLAQAAGLGWQGKHTNLVSRDYGSWLFLGAIFTAAQLAPDHPDSDRCGTCRRCLDICPTRAFPAPYKIDARRCISYLTIEHKTQIPLEFRAAIGNRIYGCDDCLAVCPWNKFAEQGRESQLWAREAAKNPPLDDLLDLTDEQFRARFKGSPIKRTGRDRFIRNVLVAAGNSGDPALIVKVQALIDDSSPLVRGMAVWALNLLAPDVASVLKQALRPKQRDANLLQEWDRVA